MYESAHLLCSAMMIAWFPFAAGFINPISLSSISLFQFRPTTSIHSRILPLASDYRNFFRLCSDARPTIVPSRVKIIGTRTLQSSSTKHSVESLNEFNDQLTRGIKLETMRVVGDVSSTPKHDLLNHPVIQVLQSRASSKSKPGERTDPYKVALSIEGGGMRGCVSAGMTAAIKDLGMEDCFDVVYGSPVPPPPSTPVLPSPATSTPPKPSSTAIPFTPAGAAARQARRRGRSSAPTSSRTSRGCRSTAPRSTTTSSPAAWAPSASSTRAASCRSWASAGSASPPAASAPSSPATSAP